MKVDEIIHEISCHALGAYYLNPRVKTIIDIGARTSRPSKWIPK